MKNEECTECAHNKTTKGGGCNILTTRAVRPCWAKMTAEELRAAERAIIFYKDRIVEGEINDG